MTTPQPSSKPFRETMVQLLATVMIPISVAGAGLYYTRWQQNLNDLKSMIDLVSDQNSERRKYGVAMFEYLLKNDKVPVEFVAAQLNYANSSSDRELLPLMEQALYKASAENSRVAETFRQALERLPSRVTVHVMNDKQRGCFSQLFTKLDSMARSGFVVAGFARATWGGTQNELRVFRDSDIARGQELVKVFGDAGLKLKLQDVSASADADILKNRPNSFDIWFGSEALPPVCGS